MKQHLFSSLKALGVFTLLLGVVYPVLITGVAQLFFSRQANGSLIEVDGKVIGSKLMAQKTTSERYFWPRPSASDYGAVPSGASNQGPTSKALKEAIDERKSKGFTEEMLHASGSGLDPHISKDAALSQVPRIVLSRQLGEDGKAQIIELVHQVMEKRDFGVLGEPRVNVLLLNLEVDKIFPN